jgi:hypothetical protein
VYVSTQNLVFPRDCQSWMEREVKGGDDRRPCYLVIYPKLKKDADWVVNLAGHVINSRGDSRGLRQISSSCYCNVNLQIKFLYTTPLRSISLLPGFLRATPFSVTTPVISSAGVTSKLGL